MLRALVEIFVRYSGEPPADSSREHEIRLATALLLIEVARADFDIKWTERQTVQGLLRDHFGLSQTELEALIAEAEAAADFHVSLQTFTRQLSEELSLPERCRIIDLLWRVALADDELSKHEDALVRKIADLLYVPHRELIRIRNAVRES
jgi:uncharacterized tellurite resistance protein B-like protein